jgi:thiosulfate/3-mercaptopyruvate sulfurtransferase
MMSLPQIPPVVSRHWLAEHPDAVVADVRWYLDGRDGYGAYLGGHLPGAVFVDLTTRLAGPPSTATGRHPLPSPVAFAADMSAVGIGDDSVVVAYDDAGGAYAGRLVWMLRLLGVDAALLDGGIGAFAGALETGPVEPAPARFTVRGWAASDLASIDDACTEPFVLDARAPERYRGESEPVDPRAGHIPGARNAFFGGNLNPDKTFKTPDELRARFAVVGITDAAGVVSTCGSGVTACHNLIALEYAGLGRGRLYAGSWSQYAATDRPAATGSEPR